MCGLLSLSCVTMITLQTYAESSWRPLCSWTWGSGWHKTQAGAPRRSPEDGQRRHQSVWSKRKGSFKSSRVSDLSRESTYTIVHQGFPRMFQLFNEPGENQNKKKLCHMYPLTQNLSLSAWSNLPFFFLYPLAQHKLRLQHLSRKCIKVVSDIMLCFNELAARNKAGYVETNWAYSSFLPDPISTSPTLRAFDALTKQADKGGRDAFKFLSLKSLCYQTLLLSGQKIHLEIKKTDRPQRPFKSCWIEKNNLRVW